MPFLAGRLLINRRCLNTARGSTGRQPGELGGLRCGRHSASWPRPTRAGPGSASWPRPSGLAMALTRDLGQAASWPRWLGAVDRPARGRRRRAAPGGILPAAAPRAGRDRAGWVGRRDLGWAASRAALRELSHPRRSGRSRAGWPWPARRDSSRPPLGELGRAPASWPRSIRADRGRAPGSAASARREAFLASR